MGKPTGFLEYKREETKFLPVEERIRDFREFHTELPEQERRKQGARCMNCGVPFCQSAMKIKGMVTGCPLHNLIPEWNDEIYQGHDRHALSRLLKTSSFPEFTGRVCPALCEKACINGMDGEPVTIHNNELYLIEKGFQEGWMTPRIPEIRSGKTVAVIGSGPSGLAAADLLNRRGHQVVVYEREDRIGGLLMYGIPNMKLDKDVVLRRQKLMEAEGVTFKTNVSVGYSDDVKKENTQQRSVSAKQLLKQFDAVVLACGAKKPRPLAVDGADSAGGIYYAVDFLKSTTKSIMNRRSTEPGAMKPKAGSYIDARGRHVVIVGGGDTGNDCVGTCIRQGAKSVTQLEMMPEPPEVRRASNPWPEWPLVKKTDYGQLEAIYVSGHDPRIYETTVKEIHKDKNGNLKEIVTAKVKFENRKMTLVEGSEQTVPCELLLIAAGFIGCEDEIADAFALEKSARGTAVTEESSYRANLVKNSGKKNAEPAVYRDKVFTAGDMHRGQSLVVWAIAEGRACAKEVDEFLMGYTNL